MAEYGTPSGSDLLIKISTNSDSGCLEYTGSSGSLLKCIIAGGSSLSDDEDGEENVNLRL